jgi:hypothetical protein
MSRQGKKDPLDCLNKAVVLKELARSSALFPRAEPILHSLDYRIELVSFCNRISYG